MLNWFSTTVRRYKSCLFLLVFLLNMQQTNTSDMLDLAVEYIKELKGQVEVFITCCNALRISEVFP